jgi:hypothetical protein
MKNFFFLEKFFDLKENIRKGVVLLITKKKLKSLKFNLGFLI